MIRNTISWCVVACFALAAGAAVADTSVWVVSDGRSSVFLGGTVHLLRLSDFPLPPEFESAYDQSDSAVFETNMDALSTPEFQARMVKKLTYPEGTSLRTVIDGEAYDALRVRLEAAGIPLAAIEQFKPGLIASTLESLEVQIALLESMGRGMESEFILMELEDVDELGTKTGELVACR